MGDDPRNPAVIADNVGDNVGDVAGMGADLFESYVGSIIAAITIANGSNFANQSNLDASHAGTASALPLWIAGFGILASVIGVIAVMVFCKFLAPEDIDTEKLSEEEVREAEIAALERLLWIIRLGIAVACVASVLFSLAICIFLFYDDLTAAFELWGCIIIGLVAGQTIGTFTEYCTSYTYSPTKNIAKKSETGPATVIIEGLGVGMLSTVVPTVTIAAAILGCNACAGVYGISIGAVGMLSTLGVTLATDAYGPVADNAGGIAEMVYEDDADFATVRDRTDALDALGNTTAATGKGFAIGSAVLTSVGLIGAFMDETNVAIVNVREPIVLTGILIGAMLPYLFGALTMLSVGRSAEAIILNVRMQFLLNDGIMKGEQAPDYDSCIKIATLSALLEMLTPGLIAIIAPIVVGLLMGPVGLAGMLAGALTSGFMLAVTMSNAGGAWDNAKKFVEKDGLSQYYNDGKDRAKKSENHKAVVVGDAVGDPFKDTSGPALNILIKLMTIVSLVLAPAFNRVNPGAVQQWNTTSVIIGVVIAVVVFAALAGFTSWAKKQHEAIASDLAKASQEVAQGEKEVVSAADVVPTEDEAVEESKEAEAETTAEEPKEEGEVKVEAAVEGEEKKE